MTDAYTPESERGVTTRRVTHVIYALFALGLISAGFLGVATLAAVVLAYVKRPDAAGTVYAAHFDWIIKTFWWSLLWFVLSALATVVFIGWLTGLVALVWVIYRIIKGWLALAAGNAPRGEL